MIWGKVPVCPNESGLNATTARRPRSFWRVSCPYRPCLTIASPHGICISGSTHQPPTTFHRPSSNTFTYLFEHQGIVFWNPLIKLRRACSKSKVGSFSHPVQALTGKCCEPTQYLPTMAITHTGSIWACPIRWNLYFPAPAGHFPTCCFSSGRLSIMGTNAIPAVPQRLCSESFCAWSPFLLLICWYSSFL